MRGLSWLAAVSMFWGCASVTPGPNSVPAAQGASVVYQEVEAPVKTSRATPPPRTPSRTRHMSTGFLAAGGLLIVSGVAMHVIADGEKKNPKKRRSAQQLEEAGAVSVSLGGAAVLTGVLLLLQDE